MAKKTVLKESYDVTINNILKNLIFEDVGIIGSEAVADNLLDPDHRVSDDGTVDELPKEEDDEEITIDHPKHPFYTEDQPLECGCIGECNGACQDPKQNPTLPQQDDEIMGGGTMEDHGNGGIDSSENVAIQKPSYTAGYMK